MKKTIKAVLAALGLAVAASPAVGQTNSALEQILDSGEFKFCFESGYMPFEMTDKRGRFIGFDIDMGKAIAKAMGVKFVPVNTAWDGIIPALLTGKCSLIFGMTITAERNLSVNFADPYFIAGQTMLVRPELANTVKSYKDLNDASYTVATQLGTSGEFAIKRYLSKAEIRLFDTSADAVQEAANGRVDAFVYDINYNAVYAAQNAGTLVHLDEPFTYGPLGWAVRKNDPDLLNFLNNYLRQIKGDGTYDRLYRKWFKSDTWIGDVQ